MTEPTSGGQPKIDVSLPARSPEKIASEGSMGEHAVQQTSLQQAPVTPTSSEAEKVSSISKEHVSEGASSVVDQKVEEHHLQQTIERTPSEQRIEDVRSSVVPSISSHEETSSLEEVGLMTDSPSEKTADSKEMDQGSHFLHAESCPSSALRTADYQHDLHGARRPENL